MVKSFNNVDEIIAEEVRLISNETMNNIKENIKEPEVEEEDEETTTPMTTTTTTETSTLNTHEILLISFSTFFETIFIVATVYFGVTGKKSSSLAACVISVLIRK